MIPYISIVGAAHAGKSTAAEFIARRYGGLVVESATAIKEIAINYFGCRPDDVYTNEGKERLHAYIELPLGEPSRWERLRAALAHEAPRRPLRRATNREVLEWIADGMNRVDPLVLVRYVWQQHLRSGQLVIDPTTREEAQAAFCRKMGGLILYVRNPEKEALVEEMVDPHHTQTFFRRTRTDITVDNTGTKEDLYLQLVEALDGYFETVRETTPPATAA